MDPISATIGAAGTFADGAMNMIGSAVQGHKNRKHQREMQRRQNEWASAENVKSREFSEHMYDKNNEYNTMANKRKRAEEAGFSPWTLVDQGAAGQGGVNAVAPSSPGSAGGGSGSGGNPFTWTPINMLGSFTDAMVGLSKARKTDQDYGFDKKYGDRERESDIDNTIADTYLKGKEAEVSQAQKASILLKNEAQEIYNKYLPQEKQMELHTLGAQYHNYVRDGIIKEEQAKELFASRLLLDAKRAGYDLSNRKARETADAEINAQNAAFRASEAESRNREAVATGYGEDQDKLYNLGRGQRDVDQWSADPSKKKWDRWIDNGSKVTGTAANAVGTITQFRNAGTNARRQAWSEREDREYFDDNNGYGYVRRRGKR